MAEGDVPFNAEVNPPVDPADQTSAILSQYYAGRLPGGAREVLERAKMMVGMSKDPQSSYYGQYPDDYHHQLLRQIGYRVRVGSQGEEILERLPDTETTPMAQRAGTQRITIARALELAQNRRG